MRFLDFIRKEMKIAKLNFHFRKQKAKIESRFVSENAKLTFRNRIDNEAVVTDNVSLGKYSFVGVNSFVDMADVGAFVSIGRNVTIGGYEHPYHKTTTAPAVYRYILGKADNYEDHAEKVIIGNDVWIGNNSCIMGG